MNKKKKYISLILSLTLVLSLFGFDMGGNATTAYAEGEQYIEWNTLANNVFSTNIPTMEKYAQDAKTGFLYDVNKFGSSYSGYLTNPDGSYYGYSAAVFGYDYASANFANAVEAEQGATYKISFKYRTVTRNN